MGVALVGVVTESEDESNDAAVDERAVVVEVGRRTYEGRGGEERGRG